MKIAILFLVLGLYHPTIKIEKDKTAIVGRWANTDDPSMLLEFYLAVNGFYYGKVVSVGKDGKGKVGDLVIKKLAYNEEDNNYKGTMNPPDANISLNAKISFVTTKQLKIVASKFLMSKTLYLNKVN
jgi:hypothetical protein